MDNLKLDISDLGNDLLTNDSRCSLLHAYNVYKDEVNQSLIKSIFSVNLISVEIKNFKGGYRYGESFIKDKISDALEKAAGAGDHNGKAAEVLNNQLADVHQFCMFFCITSKDDRYHKVPFWSCHGLYLYFVL